MTTNPYFNSFNANNEQALLESLTVEAIQQKGYDMYYLPRRAGNYLDLFDTDDLSFFDTAYTIEMYIANIQGFSGDGTFLAKFGMEIRDRVTLSVARTRFEEVITTPESTGRPRPFEGDLIFFPMTYKILEIKYVENRAQFYPLGYLPYYDIQCEVFEYNNERFSTGIAGIDAVQTNFSIDQVHYTANNVLDPTFNEEDHDFRFENEVLTDIVEPTINVSTKNPFTGQDL
jgi:hypothetical protein